jgi:hypothetical protein
MRFLLVCLLAAVTLAGARHAELLDKEIKELSIEEQVEFLKRLRGPWSAYLTRRMEVEGETWPALDELFGPVSRLTVREQEKLVRDGETEIGGRIPINTDGGLLANGEPIGASGLRQVYEVCLQLRGDAGSHQLPGAPKTGFTHVYGFPGVSCVTILSR